jgi:hypothetical protein
MSRTRARNVTKRAGILQWNVRSNQNTRFWTSDQARRKDQAFSQVARKNSASLLFLTRNANWNDSLFVFNGADEWVALASPQDYCHAKDDESHH